MKNKFYKSGFMDTKCVLLTLEDPVFELDHDPEWNVWAPVWSQYRVILAIYIYSDISFLNEK